MKYLGYSELTKRLYILRTSKHQPKIDITEDVEEYMEFIKSQSNEAKEKRIEELSEALTNTEKAYEIMRDKSEAKEKEMAEIRAINNTIRLDRNQYRESFEYWKQRCEAVERILEYNNGIYEPYTASDKERWKIWEALKNKTQ